MEPRTLEYGWTKGSSLSGANTMDKIIYYCQCNDINTAKVQSLDFEVVRVGAIAFRCDHHSTGNSIRGWILKNDGAEAFEFLNTTYWFSYAYTFNDSKHVYGIWDLAVEDAIKILSTFKAIHEHESEIRERGLDVDSLKRYDSEKAKFENQFRA